MYRSLVELYMRTVSTDTYVDYARWQLFLARITARVLVASLYPLANS